MNKLPAAAPPHSGEDILASIRKAIEAEDRLRPALASTASAAALRDPAPGIEDGRPSRMVSSDDMRTLAARITSQIARDEAGGGATHTAGGFARVLSGSESDPSGSRLRLPADQMRRHPPPLRASLHTREMPRLSRPAFRDTTHAEPFSAWDEEARAPAREASTSHLLSDRSSAATASAFERLARSLISDAAGDPSIEEMVRELLRPMLKEWLDENLPSLVEALVREEIARISRRSGR